MPSKLRLQQRQLEAAADEKPAEEVKESVAAEASAEAEQPAEAASVDEQATPLTEEVTPEEPVQ